MALRQLGDGRVGGGENLEDLRERLGRNVCSAMVARHGEGQQTARLEEIHFRDSLAPLAIARRTSSATSPSLAGSAMAAGANDWFPTQFVQVGTSQ